MHLSKLLEFVKDGDGALSSTRLAFIMTMISFLSMWILQSTNEKKVAPIDNSVIYLIGVLMMGKVAQSVSENNTETPPKV